MPIKFPEIYVSSSEQLTKYLANQRRVLGKIRILAD